MNINDLLRNMLGGGMPEHKCDTDKIARDLKDEADALAKLAPWFTFRKFWARLGFRDAQHPELPDELAAHPTLVQTPLRMCVLVDMTWGDRLRALVSGRLIVRCSHLLDVRVTEMHSASSHGVLPPFADMSDYVEPTGSLPGNGDANRAGMLAL